MKSEVSVEPSALCNGQQETDLFDCMQAPKKTILLHSWFITSVKQFSNELMVSASGFPASGFSNAA